MLTGSDENPMKDPRPFAQQIVTAPLDSPFADGHWKGSCEIGQLTAKGAAQHRILGHALSEIYVDRFKLLPSTFEPDRLYVRSTGKKKKSGKNKLFLARLIRARFVLITGR